MLATLHRVWRLFRELTGDDAYERYLTHWRDRHAGEESEPLSRAAFFREEQRRKWDGVRRSC